MWRTLILAAVLVAGCGQPASTPAVKVEAAATAVPAPTITATLAPTVAPPPAPDYRKMGQDLLVPLGGLIVATRDKSPQRVRFLAEFNVAADRALPAIARDLSVPANILHSVIANVRDAAAHGDLGTLERERLNLIKAF